MNNSNNNSNKNIHHSANEYSLFVGDLPHDCTDESLQRLFQSKFKSVKRVQIIKNEDGSSRGFGFIRFEDQADFQSALSQEMKINGITLRLDTAHRYGKNNNRGRYNSFNSTISNNSNHHNHHHFNNSNSNPHHHHHHNQSHHHHSHPHHHPQHRHQHGNHQNQTGSGTNSKTLISDHTSGTQHHNQLQHQVHSQVNSRANMNSNNSNSSDNNSNSTQTRLSGSGQHPNHHLTQSTQQQSLSQQPHHAPHLGHNLYNSNSQKDTAQQQQSITDSKFGSKQINPSLRGDDTIKSPNQATSLTQKPTTPASTSQQSSSQSRQNMVSTDSIVSQIAAINISVPATTAPVTTMPTTSVNQTAPVPAASMHNSQANLNATQPQGMGHDLRNYVGPNLMDSSHLIGATEPPSAVPPPTSIYGHMYPYGPPPPFSYMPPPPQPNPVMPISAVPPAPPNQAPSSGNVGQQHSLSASAVNANRFNPNAQQHHHSQLHHHAAQHHQPHQPAHLGAGVDATGLGAMPGGLSQAPHQGPFYYYYPSPLYFDQSGGASGAPPNHLYHPSTFHPQFFAVPGPAYLPNAHGFNQHQPTTASQSDANLLNQPPQHPQQQTQHVTQQQTHQPTQQQQAKDR